MPDQNDLARTRPFADFLAEQAKGDSHRELSVGLQELVAAVERTGRGGSLTYTVKIKPVPKAADGTMIVEDVVVLKVPKPERRSSLFFADADHNLTRDHPHQPRLPLEGLDGGAATAAAPEFTEPVAVREKGKNR